MAPSIARSIKDTMSDGPATTRTKSTNVRRQEAAAAIRVDLLGKVRNDWSFDLESPVIDIAPDLHRRAANEASKSEGGGSLMWVERTYSSSSDAEVLVRKNSLGIFETERPTQSEVDPYQFDGPEAVGTYIDSMRKAKRRRIRKETDEELAWNTSLQHWTKQRAAWTGERSRIVASTSSRDSPEGESARFDRLSMTPGSPVSKGSSDGHSANSQLHPQDLVEYVDEIPIPPPLVAPDAPIRSSVTKATYPQVYEKVCEAGMTPTIPINLKDVTLAMVQGWQKQGNWTAPKPAAPEPMFARRRKQVVQNKMDTGDPESPKHPHISKGVGAVKKVLGINGSSNSGRKDSN